MIKAFSITIFVIIIAVVTLNVLGYLPAKIKSFLVEKVNVSTENAKIIVDGVPTSTPSATLIPGRLDEILKKYNLFRFKNIRWTGEISEKINGTIPTFFTPVIISMNNTFKIEELSIDFKNLDWEKRAKDLGIPNTNTDGIAISIFGKGQLTYKNPYRTYVSTWTQMNINNNPIPISFVGYIDPLNKKLMFNEIYTNKPMVNSTETTCMPDPIGCLEPITKSWELKAQEIWLRGFTYEFKLNNEILFKDPIWDLTQKDAVQKSLEFATHHQGNVKMEASGFLKPKIY